MIFSICFREIYELVWNFLSEEQLLLKDMFNVTSKIVILEDRQGSIRSEAGFSRETWKNFAELGWLALPFSEEVGGFGEKLKRDFDGGVWQGSVVEPYLYLSRIDNRKKSSDAVRSKFLVQ